MQLLSPIFTLKKKSETESLVGGLRVHARNLSETGQLLCTEAALVSLNRGLGGGLTEDQSVAMGDSGFSHDSLKAVY